MDNNIAPGQIYKIADLADMTTWLIVTSTEYSDERDSVHWAVITAGEEYTRPYTAEREAHHHEFARLLDSTDAQRIA